MKRLSAFCVISTLLIFFAACSTKRNTALNRQWQAFTTRYNVYHNGKEHFDEQLADMEAKYEDDYTRTLFTHPAEARNNQKAPQPTGDFKRTLEKMQKSIQLHSITKKPAMRSGSKKEKEFRARSEFNPFLHNAWLTMGKGQYLNGDFTGAASTFSYIAKNFSWLPQVVAEAKIWNALSYAALGWVYEAENAIRPVKESELISKQLQADYNRAMGDILMLAGNTPQAVLYLQKGAALSSGTQRNRLWFLSGQLLSQLGNRQEAYTAFDKATKGAGIPYRTRFNARIKRSEVYAGKDVDKEVKSLIAMTRYARNQEFADQIWYAVGNLYLAQKDTAKAIESYSRAIKESTRNGVDKALAQLALGGLYFANGDYAKAQPCYTEALPQIADNYPNYKMLKLRGDVLDELALYSGNVQLQDSLLALAALSPDQRLKVAQRLAKELVEKEKREKEEADQEQRNAQAQNGNAAANIKKNDRTPAAFPSTGDDSWYFYNPMVRAQGKTEFQRRWGARKLEDDWRRRNKSAFALDDEKSDQSDKPDKSDKSEPSDQSDPSLKSNKGLNSDPHKPEFYLAQIPLSEQEQANSHNIIQEGLYNMGLILKDKLEDYPNARTQFVKLNTRYPDNTYRLDSYYNLYLMAVRDGDKQEAEMWRKRILADFADSPYGKAMADPNYFDNLRRMHQLQEDIYSDAYAGYLANDNDKVHNLTSRMEKEYPLSPILPKFVFIDALSYLTEKKNDKFKERLGYLLERWPDTDMTPMAASIIKGIRSGKQLNTADGNARGMIWNISLSNDSNANTVDSPARFTDNPDAPQYLVLAFPADSVSVNSLIYDIARFNFSAFLVKDFDLEPMNFGEIGLLIIKGFANRRDLENYRTVMSRNNLQLPPGTRPIMISKENFDLLLREGRSFEEYFQFIENPNE